METGIAEAASKHYLVYKLNLMKRIAFWSRDHKIAARILIAICHIIIFFLACYVGIGLKENNFFLSPLVFWIFTILSILITILFSKPYASFSFSKKKVLDGLILLSSFIMIVSFTNQKNVTLFTSYKTLQGSFSEKNTNVSEPKSKPSIKELKKQLKELKRMVKRDEASAGGIILAILLGAGLSALILAGACSLSCDGNGGLAVLVLLGGLTAVFFICRLIIKGTRKKDQNSYTSSLKPAAENGL
ncbi:MAG: hypothetical protein JWQ09_1853 [Segetibacter sp.]|nr:hypothetical protein [Segetibacter sp.]